MQEARAGGGGAKSPGRAAVEAARTVPELLMARVADTPDREAYRYRSGKGWSSLTWKQVGEAVRKIAGGLRALGLNPGERAAILSGTRYEWVLVDLGILAAAGATSTVYPASTADECVFILGDSHSRVVFAENDDQVAKLVSRRADLPHVVRVVVIDGAAGHDGWVVPLSTFMEQGAAADAADPGGFERTIGKIAHDDLATLIYTSGTTGNPKGVELTHDNWVYEGEGIEALGLLHEGDLQFLWLPLAHSFGKVLEVAQLRIGFATAIDGDLTRIMDNLAELKPTFSAAVPRIFEKAYGAIVSKVKAGSGVQQAMFDWAVSVGKAVSQRRQQGESAGFVLRSLHAIAEKLVLGKIKEKFGGRLRFFISGSAPLARELIEFFDAAGLLVMEGYGLTESSAGTFVNIPSRFRFGTVGHPLPGTELRIAEDGEILIKGRGIMRGYHGRAEATAESLKDGWLYTGDIGQVDPDGFLKITDRKKDLIKTGGGKYVAPQEIEGRLKAFCPYLAHVVVHGDTRKYCSALVVFEPEQIKKWAQQKGLQGSYEELAKHPEAHALVAPYMEKVNATLPKYATIKKFAVLPRELTIESGELTSSLKLKRKVVEKRFMDLLDSLYDDRGD